MHKLLRVSYHNDYQATNEPPNVLHASSYHVEAQDPPSRHAKRVINNMCQE